MISPTQNKAASCMLYAASKVQPVKHAACSLQLLATTANSTPINSITGIESVNFYAFN